MDLNISDLCSLTFTDAGFATMTLIEADYSDYLIFHLINFTSQQTIEMMMLYGRVYLFWHSHWDGETREKRKTENE